MKRIILAVPLTLAVACGPSPTAPAPLAGAQGSSAITFDANAIDSPLNGSDAQLTGFDGVSLLSYNTTKGSFTAVFDNNTVFRVANLGRFIPTDPCRQYAVDYNTAGATGDAHGLFAAVSLMSTGGCLARIHVDRTVPPNPVKSFRPLAAF